MSGWLQDWERFKKEDELRYQDECQKAKELKDIKAQQMKDMRGDAASKPVSEDTNGTNSMDTSIDASMTASKSIASQDEDDETEDDEPTTKKAKVQ